MSCEIKTPKTGEDGMLLPRNVKFVIIMEIEIATFVVKGSAKLTVPTDSQEQIQVRSRNVALRHVFDLKLRGIKLT